MKINISEDGEKIIITDIKDYYKPEEIALINNALITSISDAKEIKIKFNEIAQLRKKYNGIWRIVETITDQRD